MRRVSRQGQQGFTLVEVMVTVFVVAIGLLSAAALQAVSKKAAFDALQRSTATVIAQDMLERIRANKSRSAAYATNKEIYAEDKPTTPTCSVTTTCDEGSLVGYDLSQWWEALDGASEKIAEVGGTASNAGGLRNPAGCIRTTGNFVEVVIVWRGMTAIDQTSSGDDDPTGDTCGTNPTKFAGYYELDSDNRSYRRVLRLRAYV